VGPQPDASPTGVTWEIAQFADKDAIIVHQSGLVVLHGFDFIRPGGRELFFYYGGAPRLWSGHRAGVKLARPNQQVICLVGDGVVRVRADRAVEHGAP